MSASCPAWAQRPPPGSPLPGIVPRPPPTVGAPESPSPPAEPGQVNAALRVAIAGVQIEGATAYAPADLLALAPGLTGPAVPVASIEAARTAMLNRYRADGYVYTTVNARIRAGQLRFVVTEGRIVDVKLDGDIGPAGTQVLRFLRHLVDLQPIDTHSLERWLLLAGDVPGVSVSAVLNPSVTDPGALTLVATLRHTLYGGQVSADNRAFRQTGPQELLGQVDLNSLTAFGEHSELSFYRGLDGSETFGQASEEFFLGGSGLRVRLYGGAGETTPTGSLALFGYDGITRVGGMALSYPLIRSRQQTLGVSLAFDLVESDIATNTGPRGAPARASFDALRVLRAGADYALFDIWLGPRFAASNSANLLVSQGLPALGASANGALSAPRLGERVDFTKASGTLERTQTLFSAFAGGSVSVRLAASGQYSRNILPPEEKFYLGGPHFDRGFYYGEVTGDAALTASVEPLLDVKLPELNGLPGWIAPVPLSAQFYGFYDWGETWETQASDATHRLRSLGGGVRFYLGPRVEMDLEGVSRLTRSPDGTPPLVAKLKSTALYWQVLGRF